MEERRLVMYVKPVWLYWVLRRIKVMCERHGVNMHMLQVNKVSYYNQWHKRAHQVSVTVSASAEAIADIISELEQTYGILKDGIA